MPPYPHIVYVESATKQTIFLPEGGDTDPPDPPDPAHVPMVTVDLDGVDYRFDPAHGRRLGEYYDPDGQFVQHCIVCEDTALPGFRAYYRPDYDSPREEWVFEWGDPWLDRTPAHLGAYTAYISTATGAQVIIEVSKHYWFSRWRWQSSRRPVRRTRGQLTAAELIPHFGGGLTELVPNKPSDYSPMALCGLPANQGQTGGYPGIGILTGWQTYWLTHEGADDAYWWNQAEAAGTYQCHVRDTNAHCPIDLVETWPNASTYGDKGNPDIAFLGEPTKVDSGHLPSICYLPFLLTGDPYYLEEMQFHINMCFLLQPPTSRIYVAGRYLAWPTRACAEIAFAMAGHDSTPNWLLDGEYFEHWLEVCKGHYVSRMNNSSDPYFWFFHTVPDYGQSSDKDPNGTGDHVWQHSMLTLVASWVATLRDDWRDVAEWLVHSEVDRSTPSSGWAMSHPAPYHMRMRCASVLVAAIDADDVTIKLQYPDTFGGGEIVTIDSEQLRLDIVENDHVTWNVSRARNGTLAASHAAKKPVLGRKFTSWCETKASNQLVYGWTDPDGDAPPENSDPTYPSYMLAALAQAMWAGLEVQGVDDSYFHMRQIVQNNGVAINGNWDLAPPTQPMRRRRHRTSHDTDQQHHPELAEFRTGDDE